MEQTNWIKQFVFVRRLSSRIAGTRILLIHRGLNRLANMHYARTYELTNIYKGRQEQATAVRDDKIIYFVKQQVMLC